MTLTDILPDPDDLAVDMVLYEFELLQGKAALHRLVPDPAFGTYFAKLVRALQPKIDAYAEDNPQNSDAQRVRDRNLTLITALT